MGHSFMNQSDGHDIQECADIGEKKPLWSGRVDEELKFSLGGRELALDSGIPLACVIDRTRKGFEQGLDDMMGFFPVEQFQMKVAFCLVGKPLEKLPR